MPIKLIILSWCWQHCFTNVWHKTCDKRITICNRIQHMYRTLDWQNDTIKTFRFKTFCSIYRIYREQDLRSNSCSDNKIHLRLVLLRSRNFQKICQNRAEKRPNFFSWSGRKLVKLVSNTACNYFQFYSKEKLKKLPQNHTGTYHISSVYVF
jgi:hypothetical protein